LAEAVTNDAETRVHEHTCLSFEHQRALLEIVRERGEVAGDELHDEYEKRVRSPKSTRRRYLQLLERYELVEQFGCGDVLSVL